MHKRDSYVGWAVFDAVARSAGCRIRYISEYTLAENLKLPKEDVKYYLDKLVKIGILSKRYNLSCAYCGSMFNTYSSFKQIPHSIKCPFCHEIMTNKDKFIEIVYYIYAEYIEAVRLHLKDPVWDNKFRRYNDRIMKCLREKASKIRQENDKGHIESGTEYEK